MPKSHKHNNKDGAQHKKHGRRMPKLLRQLRRERRHKHERDVGIDADGILRPTGAPAKTTYTNAEILAMGKREWRLLVAERVGLLDE